MGKLLKQLRPSRLELALFIRQPLGCKGSAHLPGPFFKPQRAEQVWVILEQAPDEIGLHVTGVIQSNVLPHDLRAAGGSDPQEELESLPRNFPDLVQQLAFLIKESKRGRRLAARRDRDV